jgi:hypothetical protein
MAGKMILNIDYYFDFETYSKRHRIRSANYSYYPRGGWESELRYIDGKGNKEDQRRTEGRSVEGFIALMLRVVIGSVEIMERGSLAVVKDRQGDGITRKR